MLLVFEILAALLACVLIAQFLRQQWIRRRLPPGPTPVPFFGNLLATNFNLYYNTLLQMGKIYGNIFTIWMGGTPMIVLHGYKTLRNALTTHSEELSGRFLTPLLKDLVGNKGILFSSGHIWKQQRRFGMMAMRSLGLGKRSLEVRIQEVAWQLLEFLRSEKGKPLDPKEPIANCVVNVISSVVLGHCFQIDDPTFHQLMRATNNFSNIRKHSWSRLYDVIPSLMRRLLKSQYEFFGLWEKLHQFVKQEIGIHQENLSDEPADVIDYYLMQIAQTKKDPMSTYDEENLKQVVIDLFLGGSESTTTTLRWALLHMANRPEIQDKVQKELDAVLGESQVVQYEDRKKVPYTNAVIHEIQRYCDIVPVGIPRACTKDITLQGFHIKKGTIILLNLSSALFDPEHWETPNQFNPGHFLDKEGNFVNREAFLPFSTGHRVCFGEQLARVELFIIFCSLLRAFTFRPPAGVKKLNENCILSSTLHPHPYELCAVPR
ncbi:cytochrome P450 2J6-like [Lissotriton helveticus]